MVNLTKFLDMNFLVNHYYQVLAYLMIISQLLNDNMVLNDNTKLIVLQL